MEEKVSSLFIRCVIAQHLTTDSFVFPNFSLSRSLMLGWAGLLAPSLLGSSCLSSLVTLHPPVPSHPIRIQSNPVSRPKLRRPLCWLCRLVCWSRPCLVSPLSAKAKKAQLLFLLCPHYTYTGPCKRGRARTHRRRREAGAGEDTTVRPTLFVFTCVLLVAPRSDSDS